MGYLLTSRGYSTLLLGFIFALCLIDEGSALKKSKITLDRRHPNKSISCGYQEQIAVIDIVYTTVYKRMKCIEAESTTSSFSRNAHDIVVSCHDQKRCDAKLDKNMRKRCGNGEANVKKLDIFYVCTSPGEMAQFCDDNLQYGSEGLIRYGARHTTCSCVLSVQHSRRLSIFQLYSSQDPHEGPLRSVLGPPESHRKCDLLSTVMNKQTPTRSQYICAEHPLVLLYSERAENFKAQLTVMEGQLDTVFYYRAEQGQNVTLTCRPHAVLHPTDDPRMTLTTDEPQGWPTLKGDGSSEEEDDDDDDDAGADMQIIIIGASSGVVLLIIAGIVGGIIFAFRRKQKLSDGSRCPPGGAGCGDVRRSNTYTSSPGDVYQPPPLVISGGAFDHRFSNPMTEGGMYEDLVGGGPVSPPPYTAMPRPSGPHHPAQEPPPYSPVNQQVAPPPYNSHVYQMPDSAVYEDVNEGTSGLHEGRPTSAENFTYTYAGVPETVYEDLEAGAMSRDGENQRSRGPRQALRPPKAKPPVLPKPSRPVQGYDNSRLGNLEAPRDLDVSSNPLYRQANSQAPRDLDVSSNPLYGQST